MGFLLEVLSQVRCPNGTEGYAGSEYDGKMTGAELTCQELIQLISDYLEDVLPPAQKRVFEEHLALCPDCRVFLEQMRETIRAAGGLTEDSLPDDLREQLLRAFRDWKKQP
jgi:anti-sigma factor RsiW